MQLVYNLVVLHVLWVVYSLPIITIGASTTALYYSCMKMIRTNEGYVHRNFHHSFKQNFKQSTIIWLGMVVLLTLFFIPFIMLMICCGAGLIAYLTSNIFIYIFRNYLPDELEEDLERSGESFH